MKFPTVGIGSFAENDGMKLKINRRGGKGTANKSSNFVGKLFAGDEINTNDPLVETTSLKCAVRN